MSVLIKGMEMPKSRGEYTLRIYVHSDGTATIEGAYCRFEGEPFVAIPVPPHGRLIDADALFEAVFKVWGIEYDASDCNTLMSLINDAPTVIPASKEADT